MKKNKYQYESCVEKLINYNYTNFINIATFNGIKYKLKGLVYQIYLPYKDSEKLIIYRKTIPDVTLFKIITTNKLSHREILGSIMALNIDESFLGDIVNYNGNYYFYIMSSMKTFIKNNLTNISNNKITLEEVALELLENYEKQYETNQIIVSSLRIDTIISRIININRKQISVMIKNKQVILNYKVLEKDSYKLKDSDIFSIRKYGKYKFIKIIKETKKDNYLIEYKKYL